MRPLNYRDHLVDLLKRAPDVQRVEVLGVARFRMRWRRRWLAVTIAGR